MMKRHTASRQNNGMCCLMLNSRACPMAGAFGCSPLRLILKEG